MVIRCSGCALPVVRMKPVTSALVLALVASQSFAQTSRVDPVLQWMNNIAQRELDQREHAIAEIRTVADVERRKQVVREKLLRLLGGLPDYQGPLNARVTGTIRADGYIIEKIIYESLPHFYVTANLYRPDRPGRYPAVLLQSGHTQEGKAEPQLLATNLALKGFVALAFDPIGQGEREQTYDPQLKAPAAGWSVPEHIQAGAQSLLVGESLSRFFIWDAKRSLDYLLSRPEVDSTRVGAAGCSGGGALTTFTGALEPRLKAVIPACFPNSYRLLFAGPDPDSEMSPPELISEGLDIADFVELSAPVPWLIQATNEDYFSPAAAKLVYEEARSWYRLYGAENRIGFFVGPGPHGTPLPSREAIYEWMIRWLKDGRGDFHEQPVKLYLNHHLLVTRTGHVDDEPGSKKLYQLLLDDLHARQQHGTVAQLVAKLRNLQIGSDGSAPPVKVIDEVDKSRVRIQHIRFESEPGIELEAQLFIPASRRPKPALLLVSDKSFYALPQRIADEGEVVLEMQPRSSPEDRRPYVGDWLANTRADQIGRNLPAMRAHDIERGVDLLTSRSDVNRKAIRAAAQGVKGIWLLLAAAVDPRIGKIWLDKTPSSLAGALNTTMNTDLFDAVIPGFLLHWDLSDLVTAIRTRQVLWTDPTDWMGHVTWQGPTFRYRWIVGDLTDRSNEQDNAYAHELMR